MSIHVGVLGPIRITVNDVHLTLATRQMGRVATVLAGWPGEVVDSARIIDALWGSRSVPGTRNTLQAHVSQLRKVIGADHLISRDGGYLLNIDPQDVDANAFEEAVRQGTRAVRSSRFASGHRHFGRALQMWRGDAFLDVDDSELLARREILDEMHAYALEGHLECELELAQDAGDMSVLIGRARAAAANRPERERRWAILIRALAVGDRVTEAGPIFVRANEQLQQTCGLGPGAELTDTYEKALLRPADLIPATWKLHHNLRWPLLQANPGADSAFSATVELVCRHLMDAPHRHIWVVAPDVVWRDLATCLGHALRGDFRVGVHVHDVHARDLDVPVDPSPELLVIAFGEAKRLTDGRSTWQGSPFMTPTFVHVSDEPPPDPREIEVVDHLHTVALA
jgi:DNA-binding SARP family transcriptional activator